MKSTEPRGRPISLVFGGDVNLGRRQHRISAERGYDDALGRLVELQTADLVLVNLECVVSTCGEPNTKKGEKGPYFFRARPEMLNILRRAGVDAVTLANNHSVDYGEIALIDQLSWLQHFGIAAGGAGQDFKAAWKPMLLKRGNVSIAVMSIDFTQPSFAAAQQVAGTAYLDPKAESAWVKALSDQVQGARKCAQVVLACVHWGMNWAAEPTAEKRKLGCALIDAGFDAVLGTSAHVLQGIELYKGRPILHDAGDLLFDSKGKPPDGGLFRLFIDGDGVAQIDFIPTHVGFGFTRVQEGDTAEQACEAFARQCEELGTTLVRGTQPGTRSLGLRRGVGLYAPPQSPAKSRDQDQMSVDVDPAPWEVAAIPPEIDRLDIEFGVQRLLGIRILADQVISRQMIWVESFWRFVQQDEVDWRIDLQLRPKDKAQPCWGGGMDHDPCDWMVPISRARTNRIYRDFFGLRPPPSKELMDCELILHVSLVNGAQKIGPVALPQYVVRVKPGVQVRDADQAQWSKVTADLNLAADQLYSALTTLRALDPSRLADAIANTRRRAPDRYRVLSGALAASIAEWDAPNPADKVSLLLACQGLDAGSTEMAAQVAPLFAALSLDRLSSLFRSHFPANVQIFRVLLDAYLNGDLNLRFGPRALFKLAAISYIHASDAQFQRLMSSLHDKYILAHDAPNNSPQKSIWRVSTKHSRTMAASGVEQKLSAGRKRLKIALCVSGQMRAFQVAWPTWSNLGIFDHDVDVYVHTWRNVGWKFPNPQTGNGTERAFAHPPFRQAYLRCGTLYGAKAMWAAYPSFMQALARDCGQIDEAQLHTVYGKNAIICIEEESADGFGHDPKNQHKMFYKIHAAHEMARQSGISYDLFVRIRPDRAVRNPSARIDLHEIAMVSLNEGCIFGESARISNAMYVDDQFAMGALKAMDCYANTRAIQQQACREGWYGFTPALVPHLSLAQSLFFQGVRVKSLPGIRLGPIVGDAPLSREAILELLMRDIGGPPRNRMDEILVESLS